MKICKIEGCDKPHNAKGFCKNHYYEYMKEEIGKNYLKNIKYEKSLEYFAKQNNKEYLLNEYSNKNDVAPKDVSKGSDKICLWNCPQCKSEYDMSVTRRTRNKSNNCPYCAGMRVNHTNCLWTTHPDVAKLLKDKQRGYELTTGSNSEEEFVCNHCGHTDYKLVSNVTRRGFSCTLCSDGISYPEKFMINVLEQLDINFEKQKKFDWSNNRKYDFFIPSLNCIIEAHGEQHYNGRFVTCGGRGLEEERENDIFKEKVAKENNIKEYIVVDCYRSEYEYIKNSIIKSKINTLFNIDSIDWMKSHEFACSSLVKRVCQLWDEGLENTVEIGKIVNLDRVTVGMYLKKGNLLGWCNYDPKEVMSKIAKETVKKYRIKSVVQLTLKGEFIKEWVSISDAIKSLNIKSNGSITLVCNGKRKQSGGFIWMYKEDYEKYLEENIPIPSVEKTKIIQLTLEGEFVNEYKSVTDASNSINAILTPISNCCRGVMKTAYGYIWMYENDYHKTNIEEYVQNLPKREKSVVQLTLNNEFVKEWESATEIHEVIGIHFNNISAACLGKRKSSKGFRWMFKEDYVKLIK